jgi:hypothetical protein
VIDGEAVVLDAQGRPDFAALQATLAKDGSAAVAYVFDLLFLDGRDLRPFSWRTGARRWRRIDSRDLLTKLTVGYIILAVYDLRGFYHAAW